MRLRDRRPRRRTTRRSATSARICRSSNSTRLRYGCSSGLPERHVAGAEVEVGGAGADVPQRRPHADDPARALDARRRDALAARAVARRAVRGVEAGAVGHVRDDAVRRLRRGRRRRREREQQQERGASHDWRHGTWSTAARPLSRTITRKRTFPSDDAVDEEVTRARAAARRRTTTLARREVERRSRTASARTTTAPAAIISEISHVSTPTPQPRSAGVAARLGHAVAERRAAPSTRAARRAARTTA